jgi:tetratricopeptide (TPR) repeat protein/tRNA A-37 threonylcarbamoyl transferase component Bud32
MKCTECSHEVPDDAAFCARCGARLTPASGLVFKQGRYRVERLLGEGAQKRVYLARDLQLDRWVALAVFRTDPTDTSFNERLRREAHAMARLPAHPNVVNVYDAGSDDPRPFLVEEYVEGGTVADLLQRSQGSGVAVEQALRIAAGACNALAHAHAHGIVHRDVKPGNIYLTQDGEPKLGDFGLVAATTAIDSETLIKLTREGVLIGTLAYMAPEQALGKPLDPRSDLYSLGVTLYELTTGRRPFVGDEPVALVSQHMRTPPVPPLVHNPELPRPLNDLILRLLAKDPRQRPDDAAGVASALDALGTGGDGYAEIGSEALRALARGFYVGRGREVDAICRAVDRALAGEGGVVFVTGDAGMGKTRLAEHAADYARLRDANVLWGRCYEGEGAPPYWPWSQVIRNYTQDHDPETLSAVMGAGAADIAQMESEVRRRLPDLAPPPQLEPEEERFRMFDSITRFLLAAAEREPMVVLLDDLHYADRASLLLLEFLAQELSSAKLLVVGTYRDVELQPGDDLTHTLATVARLHAPRRIALSGLTESEVASYMQASGRTDADERLVKAVFEKSEGNPFFVTELVRLLEAGQPPDHLNIPDEVRDVIDRRLACLSDSCREALTVAALMGRDFHVTPLQEVAGLPAERLFEVLDEAPAAQVITEAGPGRYRFSHVLICDTLAASVPAGRRMQLHARIAAALERAFAGHLDPWLNEIAHHYLEAVPAGHEEQAVSYATAAADAATRHLAHEQAARLYEQALGVPASGGFDDAWRGELLLALGDAHASAGAPDKARDAFLQAAEIARRLSLPEMFGRAVLGASGPRESFGLVDWQLVGLLEEALGRLDRSNDAWHVRLQARLAMELSFSDQQERRALLAEQAVAAARELEDAAALAYALNARHSVLWGPANAGERLEVAGEVIKLAERAGDRQLACEGRNHRVVALLETGDICDATTEIEEHARLAEALRQPFGLWQAAAWRATIALLDGRFTEAQALADEAFALGRRVRATDAEHCYAAQSLVAAMGLGQLGELLESFRDLSDRFPATNWRWAGLPFALCEAGRREEGAALFEAAAARGFASLPRDYQWLISITALADVCATLCDRARAPELYDLLLPYAGQSVFMPEGWMCFGTVDRALGLLATTIGDWPNAAAHFEAAMALDARMGARAWLERTKLGYARMLRERGAPTQA